MAIMMTAKDHWKKRRIQIDVFAREATMVSDQGQKISRGRSKPMDMQCMRVKFGLGENGSG